MRIILFGFFHQTLVTFIKQHCRCMKQVHFANVCMRIHLCNSSQNHNTVCMPALAATSCTLLQSLLSGYPHMLLCESTQPTYSVQHILHIHNIQAIACLRLATHTGHQHVPYPVECYHCTYLFITSHSEKRYNFQMILSLPPCLSCTL